MTEDERAEESAREVKFGWSDVLAFTIAAYQVILPIMLMFFGVIVGLYLILRLWAGT